MSRLAAILRAVSSGCWLAAGTLLLAVSLGLGFPALLLGRAALGLLARAEGSRA
jgi:hypothetical protein